MTVLEILKRSGLEVDTPETTEVDIPELEEDKDGEIKNPPKPKVIPKLEVETPKTAAMTDKIASAAQALSRNTAALTTFLTKVAADLDRADNLQKENAKLQVQVKEFEKRASAEQVVDSLIEQGTLPLSSRKEKIAEVMAKGTDMTAVQTLLGVIQVKTAEFGEVMDSEVLGGTGSMVESLRSYMRSKS